MNLAGTDEGEEGGVGEGVDRDSNMGYRYVTSVTERCVVDLGDEGVGRGLGAGGAGAGASSCVGVVDKAEEDGVEFEIDPDVLGCDELEGGAREKWNGGDGSRTRLTATGVGVRKTSPLPNQMSRFPKHGGRGCDDDCHSLQKP
jgi:hypothetical protein